MNEMWMRLSTSPYMQRYINGVEQGLKSPSTNKRKYVHHLHGRVRRTNKCLDITGDSPQTECPPRNQTNTAPAAMPKTTAAMEPTLLLSMWLRAPFPFPLKLLGVAEEEVLDDALLPLELDVCALALEPVVLAAETDEEEAGDDVDAELVVEDTGGPMVKGALVPSTLETLSIRTASRVY